MNWVIGRDKDVMRAVALASNGNWKSPYHKKKVSCDMPPKAFPDSKPDSKATLHSQVAIEKQSKFLWLLLLISWQ